MLHHCSHITQHLHHISKHPSHVTVNNVSLWQLFKWIIILTLNTITLERKKPRSLNLYSTCTQATTIKHRLNRLLLWEMRWSAQIPLLMDQTYQTYDNNRIQSHKPEHLPYSVLITVPMKSQTFNFKPNITTG